MIDADGTEWLEASRVMTSTRLTMVQLREAEDTGHLQRRVTCGGGYLFYRRDQIEALLVEVK